MTYSSRDTSRRILFVGEAVTLAHVARPTALARKLAERGYRAIVAADPRFSGVCPPGNWETEEINSIATADFLRALARGTPAYDLPTLTKYVEQDLALLGRTRPAVVIGDFRLSLAVSARVAGVPYINITNAYWSPYARPRWSAPTMPWSRYIPVPLDNLIFRSARRFAFSLHARPMRALARRHGLADAGLDLLRAYTAGDVTLYADSPALVPTFGAPPSHRYLGLVDWAAPAQLPAWWQSVEDRNDSIYVTLGSSGNSEKLPRILDGLSRLGRPVIVALAGAPAPTSLPPHVHVARYLPGTVVSQRSSLVVCNGGSPTSHQALLAGVPVLGVPDNLDQVLNCTYLKAAGVGDWLHPRHASASSIERLARTMLDDGALRRRATAVAQAESHRDLTGTLEDAIADVCAAGSGNAAPRR